LKSSSLKLNYVVSAFLILVDIITFISTVVVVTASGALAPGPLFFANVTHGTKSGAKSGLAFSIAHSIVEFSLVVLLALGVLAITQDPAVKPAVELLIGVVGGIALIIFGVLQIREFLFPKPHVSGKESALTGNPLLLGFAYTGLNPYFIIWWLTAGVDLISLAMSFASWAGLILMYVTHVWMDYAWLTATAFFAKKGKDLVSSKGYRIAMALFGVALVLFGGYSIAYSVMKHG